MNKYLENVKSNLLKFFSIEFAKHIMDTTSYSITDTLICGVTLPDDLTRYIQRLYTANYLDRKMLDSMAHTILINVCWNIINHELRYTYADHILSPEVLAYGLSSGVYDYIPHSDLNFDHGDTKAKYIAQYMDKNILDDTIKLFRLEGVK